MNLFENYVLSNQGEFIVWRDKSGDIWDWRVMMSCFARANELSWGNSDNDNN